METSKLERAADELGAVLLTRGPHEGNYAYYDQGMGHWYVVTAEELAEYPEYIASEDDQFISDAYSHWCAGSTAVEMPHGWDPELGTVS